MRRLGSATIALLALVTIATPIEADERSAPSEFVVARGVHQLFLDDVGIERRSELSRVVNPPARDAANPIVTPNEGWEDYCSLYGTAIYDPAREEFRLWYLTLPRDRGLRVLDLGNGRQRAPHTTLAAYATSTDGRAWTKPRLGQFSYDGSTANNLLDLGRDNCEGLGVLYDNTEPDPAQRYKCLYWDHGSGGYEVRDGQPYSHDGPQDGVCAATSADGIHWQPIAENPVIPKYSDTTQNLLFDPKLKKYVAFGRFGHGRRMARSESTDFHHWSDPELVLECDAADGPGGQIYGAGVDLYEGVYLAMLWIYHEGGDATIDTQLATSRDGIHWTRVGDRAVWLERGDPEGWEGGMVRSVGRIIPRGEQLYIYYCGVHGAHNRPGQAKVERKHRGAIGLAIERRDGFVSLDAKEKQGELLTQPFRLPTGDLHLNVDAGVGEVQASLCNVAGETLTGCETPLVQAQDSVDLSVAWIGGDAPPVGEMVRLRITATQSKLYSYWFE